MILSALAVKLILPLKLMIRARRYNNQQALMAALKQAPPQPLTIFFWGYTNIPAPYDCFFLHIPAPCDFLGDIPVSHDDLCGIYQHLLMMFVGYASLSC